MFYHVVNSLMDLEIWGETTIIEVSDWIDCTI